MRTSKLQRIVELITVLDVLIATALITAYVYLLAEHRHELQLVQGSKSTQLLLYAYVALTNVIQMLASFYYYQVLTNPKEDPNQDIEDKLKVSRFWAIVSYVLLTNWLVKSGIYVQTRRRLSAALILCLVEVIFRLLAVYVVRLFIQRLEKIAKLQKEANNNVPPFPIKRVYSVPGGLAENSDFHSKYSV